MPDTSESDRREGIVTGVGSRSVEVFVEGDGELRCTLRGGLWDERPDETRPVAVGDRVVISVDGAAGVVEEVAPRSNQLARSRSGGPPQPGRRTKTQVIAANLDRLIMVAALTDPPFRAGLVDRYVIAARMQGIAPVLCLNKVDLGGDRAVAAPYRDAGIPVFETSAETGEGVDALAREMANGVSLLVGHSGVGKTSLLNEVSPGLALRTGAVASYHGRGRHTTTRVSLLRLDGGGWVVDSPGVREFGVEGTPPNEAARLFPGFEALADRCRFANCLHRDEPGCAVAAAVEAGELDAKRLASFRRILEDLG